MATPKSLADVLGVVDIQLPKDQQDAERARLTEVTKKHFKMTARAFCKEVLASRQYRESLFRRIVCDTLPPAIETILYHYAEGKPVEQIEVKDTTTRLEDLTPEQLERRLSMLQTVARKLRDGEPLEPVGEPIAPSGTVVH